MLIFYRPVTDPYLNLAAEEYFVKHAVEDMCMLWVNQPSVIIGKHQNALAEINYPFVRAHQIPVIRRISGGGAVYHDTGNVNFTFVQKTGKTNPVDFGRFTSVIKLFMQSLGMDINISKRNSLFVGDHKFSGHAEHIFHDRVLHHGTILFNTDLQILEQCLSPVKEYTGKAMVSVRSEVVNIAPLLPRHMDIQEFTDAFTNWLLAYYPGSSGYQLSIDEQQAIQQLSESKYKTWQWNFGYSPAYTFRVMVPLQNACILMDIKVLNGKITQLDFPSVPPDDQLYDTLQPMCGLLHKEEEIAGFIEINRNSLELAGVNIVYLYDAFFM